jgi:hypothetical protein
MAISVMPSVKMGIPLFNDLQLSATAKRVVHLLLKLPHLWTNVFMDNLFNSRKLYTAAYRAKKLCHGVVRHHGRGVPDHVVQKPEPESNEPNVRGRTKAAVLRNDPDCPDLICCSVYDTKPVHIMSTVAECVEWDEKSRRVWSSELSSHVQMKYLRLNLIDIYNFHMNSVDMADQLRNHYRFNHWFRNRKWWWSIFLWAVGVAATNAFIVYDSIYDEERAKKLEGLPRKWSHLEFLSELIYDFMGWQSDDCELVEDNDLPVSSNTRSSSASVSERRAASSVASSTTRWKYNLSTAKGREAYLTDVPTNSITVNRMNTTFFSIRKDGRFHAMIPTEDRNSYCQLCKYNWTHVLSKQAQKKNAVMKNNRCSIKRCIECNVNLCAACINEWHGFDWGRINDCVNE